jgi:hypothetical protein
MLDKNLLLYFVCMLAGFGLLKVSVAGTFLAGLAPVLTIIGVLAVIVFAVVLLVYGVLALFGR